MPAGRPLDRAMTDAVLKVALPLPLPQLFDYLPAAGGRFRYRRRRTPGACVVRQKSACCGVVAGGDATDAQRQRPRRWNGRNRPLLPGRLLSSLRWLTRYLHAPAGRGAGSRPLPATLRRGEPLPDTHAWAGA